MLGGLDHRVASVMLVIVVAWALSAVVLLTGIEINLHGIDNRVVVIDHQLDPIKRNTAFIRLAGRTAQLTTGIKRAARPLPGELGQVRNAAGQINAKVGSIYSTARAINRVAYSINGNVHTIDATVHGINGSVGAIWTKVQSIAAEVDSVAASVASIHRRVAAVRGAVGPPNATGSSINGDVSGIDAGLRGTLSTAKLIRTGVIGINNRAQAVIAVLQPIKNLFDGILGGVGTQVGTATVLGHANSIDCSNLIEGRNCNRTGQVSSAG